MKRKEWYKLNRKGFSLGELLIVVAIISILVGISIPLFSQNLRKQQLKHVEEQELAAKVAAVTAFYAGYDSKGNKVDISLTGFCSFLYDAENGAVYVSNKGPAEAMSDFEVSYNKKISNYGLSISSGEDYYEQVILVYFDGRYYKKNPDSYLDYDNLSKGTFEEPAMYVKWYPATKLVTTVKE